MMEESVPKILEYFPEQPRVESSAVAIYLVMFPLIVGTIVAFISPYWALPSAASTVFLLWWRDRRLRKRPALTLRISRSRLRVTDPRGHTLLKVKLSRLENVTLDTRTIEKVQENLSSGVPDLRFIDSRVGPAIDNSRIELVTRDDVFALTDHYTSSTDASEWFAKIRRFLRKNGWTPLDERTGR